MPTRDVRRRTHAARVATGDTQKVRVALECWCREPFPFHSQARVLYSTVKTIGAPGHAKPGKA